MSTKAIVINGQSQQIQVEVPSNLYPIISAKRRVKQFFSNVLQAPICYVCGVNYAKLAVEELDWVKQNICASCDKKTPYIPVSVTEIATFAECQMQWYFANVLNIPQIVTTAMLEGIIAHEFDNIIVKLMNDAQFFDLMRQKFPSRYDMYNEIIKRLNQEYDVIIKNALSEMEQCYIPEKALLNLKRDIFDKLLDDFAYLAMMRLYNDIMYGGEYRKLVSRRWEEKRVYGHLEHDGVKLFIMGRIDKLYQLGDNKFFIRDDKSLRVVRTPSRGKSLYSYSLQLGGYAYCLQQMYAYPIEAVGVVWLLRFADVAPTECDVEKFVETCRELCEMISKGKAPSRCMPRVGLCHPDYCGNWNECWGLEGR